MDKDKSKKSGKIVLKRKRVILVAINKTCVKERPMMVKAANKDIRQTKCADMPKIKTYGKSLAQRYLEEKYGK